MLSAQVGLAGWGAGLTIEPCSLVAEVHVVLKGDAELTPRSIPPALPGPQQFLMVPGGGHDFFEVYAQKRSQGGTLTPFCLLSSPTLNSSQSPNQETQLGQGGGWELWGTLEGG